MKEGWETKSLGDVLEVLRNGVNCKQDKKGSGDKISRIESISNADFDIEKVGFTTLSDSDKEKYRLYKGDILFSHINSPIHVGKTALFDSEEEVYHGVNLLLMRPKKFLHVRFFEHYLKYLFQNGYWKRLCKQSVNQASVNQQDINKVEINYPPLPEQQRIVAILDEAFAAIAKAKANAEQNLKNAKELFESYLHGVFENKGEGWEEKSLEELADESCTLSYGIVQPGEEFENGLPVVRPTDLTSRYIKVEGLKRIDPKLADGYKRTKLIGDELLLCVRGTTGVVSIATPELKNANVTRGIVPIRFNSKFINQEFGYYLLISNYVQKQIRAKTYGAALMQINIGDLRKILTPYPSIKDQHSIVRQLDALRVETQRLAAVYQQKLADLEELKKSILQKAFAGELKTEVEVRL